MSRWSDPPIWKTKDGRHILPSQMSDLHLANTLTMVRRRLKELEELRCEAHSYYDECTACAYCDGMEDNKTLTKAWEVVFAAEVAARPDGIAAAQVKLFSVKPFKEKR